MRERNGFSYQFGPFQLDAKDRMLLREGEYVPLAPKVFETLLALVEHRGRIVDKEELLKEIWPNTFVEEVSLAKNVSTLRKALDDTHPPRYIETIPKRGYRFVAEVRPVVDGRGPDPDSANPVPGSGPLRGHLRRTRLWWAGSLLAVTLAGLVWWSLRVGHFPNPNAPSPKTIPVTSYPGHESQAAFSPDSARIAFVWDRAPKDTPHIYVKVSGKETPLQLTSGPGSDSKPAWSPDGKLIWFLRTSADQRVWYQIPAPGGPVRKLAEVSPYFDLGSGNSPYAAPDGNSLAIVDKNSPGDPASIFLLSLRTLELRKVTAPPAGTTGDYYPAFSPDGRKLAFARAVSFSATDLYVMALSDGKPKRLTFDGVTIEGLAWTADGRDIVFSSRRGDSVNALWRIAAAGGEPERLGAVGKDVSSPAISVRGGRLAYTQSLDDMNIWRFDLDATGQVASKAQVIASTFRDSDPDYAPDGARIAFVSGRSGGFGIWVSNADGSDPHLLFDGGAHVTGSPRWSPDGRWIAFDTRSNNQGKPGDPDIYLVSAGGGAARRVTAEGGGVAPSWSHDGRWIYFGSTRTGRMEIWKTPRAGGAAMQITRQGGFEAFESADGQYLYYLKGRTTPGIWRVPTGGGEETLVTIRNQAGLWRYWRIAGDRIYYATAAPPSGPRLEFLDLRSRQVHDVLKMERASELTIPGLAVSPDGMHILCAQYDQSGSDIMMVDHFR